MKKTGLLGIAGLGVVGLSLAGIKYTGGHALNALASADQYIQEETGLVSETTILRKGFFSSDVRTTIDVTAIFSSFMQGIDASANIPEKIMIVTDYELKNRPLSAKYNGTMDIVADGNNLFKDSLAMKSLHINGKIGLSQTKGEIILEGDEYKDEDIDIKFSNIVLHHANSNDFKNSSGQLDMPNIEIASENNLAHLEKTSIDFSQNGNWLKDDESYGEFEMKLGSFSINSSNDESIKSSDIVYAIGFGVKKDIAKMTLKLAGKGETQQTGKATADINLELSGVNLTEIKPFISQYHQNTKALQARIVSGAISLEEYISQTEDLAQDLIKDPEQIQRLVVKTLNQSDIKLDIKPSTISSNMTGEVNIKAKGFAEFKGTEASEENIIMAVNLSPMMLLEYINADVLVKGLPPALTMMTGVEGGEDLHFEIKDSSILINGNKMM